MALLKNDFSLQQSKTASQSSYMAGVSQLSDEDLAEELRRYGEDPGPIMETTRGVYQRQLAKLMAERTKGNEKMMRRLYRM